MVFFPKYGLLQAVKLIVFLHTQFNYLVMVHGNGDYCPAITYM